MDAQFIRQSVGFLVEVGAEVVMSQSIRQREEFIVGVGEEFAVSQLIKQSVELLAGVGFEGLPVLIGKLELSFNNLVEATIPYTSELPTFIGPAILGVVLDLLKAIVEALVGAISGTELIITMLLELDVLFAVVPIAVLNA